MTESLLKRNRNFRTYFAAAGITNLGDGISSLAFPWLATLITRDPFWIGFVAAAQRLPWLLVSLPAGVIIDRSNRRNIIVLSDGGRFFLTLCVVGVILSAPQLPLEDDSSSANSVILFLSFLAFLLGTGEVFRDNAAQTALPQIVDKPDLEKANGQLWSIEMTMSQFIGPPLAGFLIAVAVPLPFVFDALTFCIAACLIWAIPFKTVPSSRTDKNFKEQLVEGFRWIHGHETIWLFAILLATLNFVVFGSLAILVLFSQDILGLSATGHGFLLAAGAAGAVLGGLWGPRIYAAIGFRHSILVAVAMFIPSFLAIATTANPITTGASLGCMWFFGMLWNVVTVSYRQRVIPAELLGRVNSIYRFFGWGAIPLGSLASGTAVSLLEDPVSRDFALRFPFYAGAVVCSCILIPVFLKVRNPDDVA